MHADAVDGDGFLRDVHGRDVAIADAGSCIEELLRAERGEVDATEWGVEIGGLFAMVGVGYCGPGDLVCALGEGRGCEEEEEEREDVGGEVGGHG